MEPSTSLPPASSCSGMSRAKNWLFTLFFNEDQPSDGSGFGWPFNGLRYGIFHLSNVHRLSASMHKATASSLRSSDLAPLRKSQKRPTGPSPLVRLPKIVPTVPSSIPESKEQSRLNLASSSLLPSEASPPPLKKQFSEYDLTQTLQSRISSSCSPKSGSDTPTLSQESDFANNLVGKRDIRVLFIYGKPGIGKSTFVFERYPGAIGNLLENGGMVIADKKLLCSMILTALGSVALNFCESLTPSQLQWKLKGLSLTYQPPTSSSRPTTSQNPGTANTS